MMFSSFENLDNYEIQFAKGNSFLKVKEEHLIYENTCSDLYLIIHNTCSDLYIISYILYIKTPVVTYSREGVPTFLDNFSRQAAVLEDNSSFFSV